jgi:hypothetical protein
VQGSEFKPQYHQKRNTHLFRESRSFIDFKKLRFKKIFKERSLKIIGQVNSFMKFWGKCDSKRFQVARPYTLIASGCLHFCIEMDSET